MEKGAGGVVQEIRPAAEREGHQLSQASAHGCDKGNALTCSVLQTDTGGIAWEAARQVCGHTQGLDAFPLSCAGGAVGRLGGVERATGGVARAGGQMRLKAGPRSFWTVER